MFQELGYAGRVIWACMKKDIKTALSERIFTILGVFIPVNFLILMSLFVLAGSSAPTAVVLQDSGPYAQKFYDAMSHAHSFRLQQATAKDAHAMLQAGQIVAVVTVPADFDTKIQQDEPVQVNVDINNLNTDFTNDIRRAVPLSITSFYAKSFPNIVTITTREHDFYSQDTDYIPYISVSILVLGLAVGGLLQAGIATAREWDRETIKEVLLSPASRLAVITGKMLAAILMSLISTIVVLIVLIFVIGVYPAHWGEVVGFTLLSLVLFTACGMLFGTLLKQTLPVTALTLGISVPLFFLSGAFGPLSLNTQVIQVIAQIFPLYYAIVLQQHAFHNFILNSYGLNVNILILCGYIVGLLALALIVLRRSTVAH
jgi:ABC-type multidrug transport system permease subunit